MTELSEVRPLDDRIIVRQETEAERTASGLYIPQVARDVIDGSRRGRSPCYRGQVVASGPGLRLSDGSRRVQELKKGDRVIFGPYSGDVIKFNGELLITLREPEILAVIEEE